MLYTVNIFDNKKFFRYINKIIKKIYCIQICKSIKKYYIQYIWIKILSYMNNRCIIDECK